LICIILINSAGSDAGPEGVQRCTHHPSRQISLREQAAGTNEAAKAKANQSQAKNVPEVAESSQSIWNSSEMHEDSMEHHRKGSVTTDNAAYINSRTNVSSDGEISDEDKESVGNIEVCSILLALFFPLLNSAAY
jgi:hypothetical protein